MSTVRGWKREGKNAWNEWTENGVHGHSRIRLKVAECRLGMTVVNEREREGKKVSECEASSNKEQEIERESSQTSRAQKTKVRILTSAAFHY